MNIQEFKAWLTGFERHFWGGKPNRSQWLEIRKRLRELNPEPSHVILVTPNTDLGRVGEMRVVALDEHTYAAIKGEPPIKG